MTNVIQMLHSAWNQGDKELFERILLENHGKLDIKSTDLNGRTALWLASAVGATQSVALLIKQGGDKENACPKTGMTPLHAAIFWGHQDSVISLISQKPNVNARDIHGQTPLMKAVLRGSTGGFELTNLLLKAKADVNIQDQQGTSALMMAASRRQTEIAELLLTAGAQVNQADVQGRTALMLAANLSIIRLLLNNKANPNLKDKAGRTVFDIFQQRPEALNLLIPKKE